MEQDFTLRLPRTRDTTTKGTDSLRIRVVGIQATNRLTHVLNNVMLPNLNYLGSVTM